MVTLASAAPGLQPRAIVDKWRNGTYLEYFMEDGAKARLIVQDMLDISDLSEKNYMLKDEVIDPILSSVANEAGVLVLGSQATQALYRVGVGKATADETISNWINRGSLTELLAGRRWIVMPCSDGMQDESFTGIYAGTHWGFIIVDTEKKVARWVDSLVSCEQKDNRWKITGMLDAGTAAGKALRGLEAVLNNGNPDATEFKYAATTLKHTPHQGHNNTAMEDPGACGPFMFKVLELIITELLENHDDIKAMFPASLRDARIFNSVDIRAEMQHLLEEKAAEQRPTRRAEQQADMTPEERERAQSEPDLGFNLNVETLRALLTPDALRRMVEDLQTKCTSALLRAKKSPIPPKDKKPEREASNDSSDTDDGDTPPPSPHPSDNDINVPSPTVSDHSSSSDDDDSHGPSPGHNASNASKKRKRTTNNEPATQPFKKQKRAAPQFLTMTLQDLHLWFALLPQDQRAPIQDTSGTITDEPRARVWLERVYYNTFANLSPIADKLLIDAWRDMWEAKCSEKLKRRGTSDFLKMRLKETAYAVFSTGEKKMVKLNLPDYRGDGARVPGEWKDGGGTAEREGGEGGDGKEEKEREVEAEAEKAKAKQKAARKQARKETKLTEKNNAAKEALEREIVKKRQDARQLKKREAREVKREERRLGKEAKKAEEAKKAAAAARTIKPNSPISVSSGDETSDRDETSDGYDDMEV
ncbi:hypothetical protein J1614_007996 [Plenodomus biglobosus]|nr:hypothetical protein J1614_007996 [Plenodomus biglobosus]